MTDLKKIADALTIKPSLRFYLKPELLIKHEPKLTEGHYGDGVIYGCNGCNWTPSEPFDDRSGNAKYWKEYLDHLVIVED